MPKKSKSCPAAPVCPANEISVALDRLRTHIEGEFVVVKGQNAQLATSFATLNATVHEQNKTLFSASADHEERLRAVEKGAWKLAGIGAACSAFLGFLAWAFGFFTVHPKP